MKGGSKEAYLEAKRETKRAIHLAKKRAEERELHDLRFGKDMIYRIAKQMRREHQDHYPREAEFMQATCAVSCCTDVSAGH